MSLRDSAVKQDGAIFKLFVSGDPSCKIIFAQSNFFSVFGYKRNHLPMPLQKFYSNANAASTTAELRLQIFTGGNYSSDLNLVDVNGKVKPCHVQVTAGGCGVDRYATMTIYTTNRVSNASSARLDIAIPPTPRKPVSCKPVSFASALKGAVTGLSRSDSAKSVRFAKAPAAGTLPKDTVGDLQSAIRRTVRIRPSINSVAPVAKIDK